MRLLKVILPRGKGSKFMDTLKSSGAHAITCYYGYGSANNALSNALHTDKIKKEIVMAILEEDNANICLNNLNEQLQKSNTGIAFTLPLNTGGEEFMDKPFEYAALYVIVDRQEGHRAVQIAQDNGARGATLVHGRGSAEKVKSILMNMNIEPEKDIVIMLVKRNLIEPIRQAIYEDMNLEEKNKGIIYSLPVMDVRGLVDQA